MLALSFAESFREATVATKPGHRGEHEGNRKTIAQGKPGCFRFTCGPTPVLSLHGTHGCNRHPAFPAPSSVKVGEVDANLGRTEPREQGRMSLLSDKLNLSRAGSVAAIPASGPSCCVAGVNGCSLQWLGQGLDQCNHSRRRSCATHPRTQDRLAERRH